MATNNGKEYVTLKDIAQRLNLSVTTVADALKDRPNVRVAPGTREFVRSEAARLGYQPNLFARRLVNRRASNLIGLVSSLMTGSHIRDRQYTQIRYALAQTEYELAFVSAAHLDKLADAVAAFVRLQPAALLWGTEWKDTPELLTALNRYIESGGVVIRFDDEREAPCDAVIFDEVAHTEVAARHLLEMGHRFIGVSLDEWPWGVHAQGLFRALTAFGLDAATAIRVYPHCNAPNFENGTAIAEQWLWETNRPAAMCLWSDKQAAGFMRRVADAGVRIPEDVSVIGHDNEVFCPYLTVPLTTVTRSDEGIIEAVMELLYDRLDGRYSGEPRRRVIHSRLIVRQSVRAV